MSTCKIVHCGTRYEGHVTKICAICWDNNFEVCPSCYDMYEKVVCPGCLNEGMNDNAIDRLSVIVGKYSLKEAMEGK